jgi:glycerol-3-phosphate acyltransferase PlsY
MWQATAVVAAYLIGGICSGYYLVLWRRGIDVRDIGSGSAGGTNAAKALGAWARYVVGGLDLLKGAVAVAAGLRLGLGPVAMGAVVIAVVLGHVYPVQLGFRGGKGIGTSLGALLVYSMPTALAIGIVAAVLMAATKRLQVSGVTGYAVAACLVPLWASSVVVWACVAITVAIVIHANRANFLNELRAWT